MYDAPIRAEVISLAFYRWTSGTELCKLQNAARERGGVARDDQPCGGGRAQGRLTFRGVSSSLQQSSLCGQGSFLLMIDYKIVAKSPLEGRMQ